MSAKRGQAVVLTCMVVLVIAVLGNSLLTHSLSASHLAQRQQLQEEAFYLAEGALEDVISRFSQAIANFEIDANAPRYPAAGVHTTTFSSGATASSIITEAEPTPRTVPDPDGINIFVKNYRVRTTVQHPTAPGVTVTLNQVVARRLIYSFQHAVFYDGDLEWLPGPDTTLAGRVHSNADMYLGAGSLLTVNSEYVRAFGKIYNRRKDSTTPMNGIVQIKKAGMSTYVAMTGLDSNSPTWTAESQTRWLGTVKSDVHGVTKRAVPVVGSIAPGGYYHTQADVRIVNGTITDKNGNPLPVPAGTIQSTTTFYNNREGKTIRMTEIDLKKLAGYLPGDPPGSPSGANFLPTNGLIYATRDDAIATEQPGIRLINGSEIYRAGGLTVVSNDPVYIKGTFNTVTKKPVAVIADALNLLSNSWDDNKDTQPIDNRIPTATTVNSAFIAGIKTTTTGNYNGGLENYPRLHEKWTGVTLTITGSFVSLWNSEIATGNWQYGNPQYTAPIRNWSYETSFASGTSIPPFSPFAVEIVKGAWWKE
ncbi:MAG: pilus assembly PilX N-terminal domain-containing protein [Candidatus Omnitrophica bacterium]|nr:pilus assembly PilX N-terminal domain-containing protein [Candidatus Omnitrophota bacterium]